MMTVSPSIETVFTVLEEIGEETPCDYYDEHESYGGGPARWVLWEKCPDCGDSGIALACNTCKEGRMNSEAGVVCDKCETVIVPARHAYYRVEPI